MSRHSSARRQSSAGARGPAMSQAAATSAVAGVPKRRTASSTVGRASAATAPAATAASRQRS